MLFYSTATVISRHVILQYCYSNLTPCHMHMFCYFLAVGWSEVEWGMTVWCTHHSLLPCDSCSVQCPPDAVFSESPQLCFFVAPMGNAKSSIWLGPPRQYLDQKSAGIHGVLKSTLASELEITKWRINRQFAPWHRLDTMSYYDHQASAFNILCQISRWFLGLTPVHRKDYCDKHFVYCYRMRMIQHVSCKVIELTA